MKILITGAGGLVGRALAEHCNNHGDAVFAHDRSALDITDVDQVERLLTVSNPDVVINCAAWTDVDGCEMDVVRCRAVNEIGPENLARASRKAHALLITISTDYVFDGTKDEFYTQRDNPNPLSVYAQSKLEGERRAQLQHARTIVVRSGFIFGQGGRNFLSTVVDRVRRGERPKVIRDAWGTPTYANDLAVRLRELAVLDLPGIFHVVNSGVGATYETFAKDALKLSGYDESQLESVSFDSLTRPAKRPRNSRLRCLLSEPLGLQPLPSWQNGLARFVEAAIQKANQTRQFVG
ncbi:MAG TPA: dTDP-4-dehydrorhamnose reductase [Pyrinomonadaceae bacterium]|nr:dTDP-4-dehydrorhamnose reductase [Pyrinomonadaceae bacterium]